MRHAEMKAMSPKSPFFYGLSTVVIPGFSVALWCGASLSILSSSPLERLRARASIRRSKFTEMQKGFLNIRGDALSSVARVVAAVVALKPGGVRPRSPASPSTVLMRDICSNFPSCGSNKSMYKKRSYHRLNIQLHSSSIPFSYLIHI